MKYILLIYFSGYLYNCNAVSEYTNQEFLNKARHSVAIIQGTQKKSSVKFSDNRCWNDLVRFRRIVDFSNVKLKKGQGRHKNNLDKSEAILWLALGIISIIFLFSVKLMLGLTMLPAIGLIFLTIATGIGFFYSKKNSNKAKSKFPKALFIASIIINCLAILFHFIKLD